MEQWLEGCIHLLMHTADAAHAGAEPTRTRRMVMHSGFNTQLSVKHSATRRGDSSAVPLSTVSQQHHSLQRA